MKLVFIDVETTGLNPERDHLLEVACRVTDTDLTIVSLNEAQRGFAGDDGFHGVVGYDADSIIAMRDQTDPYVVAMHDNNGLWDALPTGTSLSIIDTAFNTYLRMFETEPRQLMLAGNSCRLDLNFVEKFLPRTYELLHYRSLDVTSLRQAAGWWANAQPFVKPDTHRAMDDVMACIDEARHYRKQLGW